MRRALALLCARVGAAAAHPEASRPTIDLAAVAPPTANGRPWPLAELPSLQPHLDLAMANDACTDAAKQRHAGEADVLAYLIATSDFHDGAFDKRLAALQAMTPERCSGKAQPGPRRTTPSAR